MMKSPPYHSDDIHQDIVTKKVKVGLLRIILINSKNIRLFSNVADNLIYFLDAKVICGLMFERKKKIQKNEIY